MAKSVEKLPEEFYGKGEVRGFHFKKVWENNDYYIFEVHPAPNKNKHYELIERKETPVCLDFENKVYSETNFKERFPKAKDFGYWAWSYPTFEKAWREGEEKFKKKQHD